MVYRHLAVAAATAAAVWAYLRNRASDSDAPSETPSDAPSDAPEFRESIASAVAQCPLKNVPFNVMYTAALYAMWPDVSFWGFLGLKVANSYRRAPAHLAAHVWTCRTTPGPCSRRVGNCVDITRIPIKC